MIPLSRAAFIAVLIAAGILAIMYWWSCNRNRELAQENRDLGSVIAEKNDTTRYYQNIYQQEVASKRSAEASLAVLKRSYGNLDTIARRFQLQLQDLRSYVEYASHGRTVLRDTGRTNTVKEVTFIRGNDTCWEVSRLSHVFRSPYYRADVTLGRNFQTLVLDRWDTTYVAFSWKLEKKGFLGIGRQYSPQISVVQADTSVRNVIRQSFNVRQNAPRPPRFDIAAFVGYTLPANSDLWKRPLNALQTRGEFRVGLGLSFNLRVLK